MRYLIRMSYDGSLFHGFQRQQNEKNIQSKVEDALQKILNEKIEIKGAGRTDAKVHALSQTAHFDTTQKLPINFLKRLNKELHEEIKIKSIKKVSNNFHARFSVKEKKYRYLINFNKNKKNDNYYFTSYYNLDINKMKEVSRIFLGTHDFEAFVSGYREDYTTHIYKITFRKKNNMLIIEFVGTGFYRYMIRHLVGALYDVGRHKKNKSDILKKLNKEDITIGTTVMPAYGLYLVNVKY